MDPIIPEEYHSRLVKDSEANHGALTVGLLPSINQVSALVQKGDMEPEVAIQVTKL